MTDKEKLIELLDGFGIEFTIQNNHSDGGEMIVCEVGGEKVEGFAGSSASFNFDDDNKFANMGVYE